MSRLFGTDGVRGEANLELTPELAYRMGRAATLYFGEDDSDEAPVILIGRDTRISGPMFEAALVAGICSADGRHLAMMPHLERAIFPWQCGTYPQERRMDEVTPWIEAFVNARKWIEQKQA